ncbi:MULTISPECIES: DUF7296 family protein [Bacillus]|uniref:DUF7296 domain-containing protein n=1 Tax=Bacillus glycinifermentans TaxID=1664069 RepID=A0A0T6BKC4_9BACI|nr:MULTISPECIES: hypothetical protein [Bacillus]KRT89348.1 hypothetical protein AB447_224320 [Bacillus glycinifermentans]MEC0477876.1 hypothetical protein [Bacillus licheniformis]MEC0487968.1 hypothetical protein [Bacillus glycinifermentans]MEC0494288.1 hypothetical protein [Bacillus glycinifermentans]MEC0540703.1 hypothetical protein [Bacillus glycinifermentans]
MAFYEYTQNNSGGSFITNDKLCHRIFIEANSYEEADTIAEGLGVYWNGVSEGIDCDCCGDRWGIADPVDLDRINKKGWEAGVYSNIASPEKEEEWKARYGNYPIHTAPVWSDYIFRNYSGKIAFESIEQYAQFLADEYGWTTPDARIFYKDGTIAEINKRKANEGADEIHAD